MARKIIVVGGVAGGASAATRLRRLDENAQITVYERGADASFSNCSLPFLLSGIVPTADALVMVTPEKFRCAGHLHIAPTVAPILTAAPYRNTILKTYKIDTGAHRCAPYRSTCLLPSPSSPHTPHHPHPGYRSGS